MDVVLKKKLWFCYITSLYSTVTYKKWKTGLFFIPSVTAPSSSMSNALYLAFLAGGDEEPEEGGGPGGSMGPSSGSSTSGAIGKNCSTSVSSVSSSELQNAATGSTLVTST